MEKTLRLRLTGKSFLIIAGIVPMKTSPQFGEEILLNSIDVSVNKCWKL